MKDIRRHLEALPVKIGKNQEKFHLSISRVPRTSRRENLSSVLGKILEFHKSSNWLVAGGRWYTRSWGAAGKSNIEFRMITIDPVTLRLRTME